MPTNRRKRTRGQQGLDYWKLEQLTEGHSYLLARAGYYPKGALGGCNHWTEDQWEDWRQQVETDWHRYGHQVLAWWYGETEQFTAMFDQYERKRDPNKEPWALREFGLPKE